MSSFFPDNTLRIGIAFWGPRKRHHIPSQEGRHEFKRHHKSKTGDKEINYHEKVDSHGCFYSYKQ
jgi:hypothetical protein